LSETYLRAGRVQAAQDLAVRALSHARERKERGHEGWTLRLLGEIATQPSSPDVEQAEAYYRQALTLAEELSMRPLVAQCYLGLGTLYQKIGHAARAQADLTTAAELYRAMEMGFWLAQADAALAQVGAG